MDCPQCGSRIDVEQTALAQVSIVEAYKEPEPFGGEVIVNVEGEALLEIVTVVCERGHRTAMPLDALDRPVPSIYPCIRCARECLSLYHLANHACSVASRRSLWVRGEVA